MFIACVVTVEFSITDVVLACPLVLLFVGPGFV